MISNKYARSLSLPKSLHYGEKTNDLNITQGLHCRNIFYAYNPRIHIQ